MAMTLLLPLLIPLLGSFLVLLCKSPKIAARMALALSALELLALSNVVWTIHRAGASVQDGRLPARRWSHFLFPGQYRDRLRLSSLVYSVGYLRHIPEGRFSSPRWFYALLFLFLFTMVACLLIGKSRPVVDLC